MAGVTFREGTGVNDSIFGKSQEPIKMLIEKKAEAFEQQSIANEIFVKEKSNSWADKFTSMTAMDGFQPVGESGEYPTDGMQEGYSKVLENTVWKDSFSISREIIDDSKTIDLKKRPAAFVTAYYRTRERFAAALLGAAVTKATTANFGGKTFDTTTADGVCLFSKVHPSKVGKSNQSNQYADAFSNDALMAAEAAMQGYTGDNGEILAVAPNTIIIPNDYALKKAVFAAIGADKDPATSNNGFNYNFGRWNVIVWAYLNQFITSGTSPWILADLNYNKEYNGAIWIDRKPLEVTSEIAHNDDNEWKGYARFTAGFNDWRAFSVGGVSGGTQLIST